MDVKPVLTVLPRIYQLRHWKLGNFDCVYLGTIVLEMQASKKLRQTETNFT